MNALLKWYEASLAAAPIRHYTSWLELALANVLVLVLVNALLHLALAGVSAESAPENAGNYRVCDGKLSKFVLGIRAIINDV